MRKARAHKIDARRQSERLWIFFCYKRHTHIDIARRFPALGIYKMTVRIRVIPCLDVRDGRVVKGVNFVDLKDAGDPVEQARAYDTAGADELCFLDISASHEGRGTLLDVVRRTAEVCFMPLTVITGRALYDGRLDLAAAIAMAERA